MNNDPNQVITWLAPWQGKEIQIIKEEDGDQDIVNLRLELVDVRKNGTEDLDGYVAPKALLLHGEGVVAGRSYSEHLPQDVFEIPISEYLNVTKASDFVRIESDRASYTISLTH